MFDSDCVMPITKPPLGDHLAPSQQKFVPYIIKYKLLFYTCQLHAPVCDLEILFYFDNLHKTIGLLY